MSKSLRYEVCRILWPDTYSEPLEPGDAADFSVGWSEPDDNDILDAVRDLIDCRDSFAIVADFMATRAEKLKSEVDDVLEGLDGHDAFLPNIGAKKK